MKKSLLKLLAAAGLGAVGLLSSSSASGAYITINDAVKDPFMIASAGDFENGVTVNGVFAQGLGVGTGNVSVDESLNSVHVTGNWITFGDTRSVNQVVYFIEPSAPSGTSPISDILIYSITPNGDNFTSHIDLQFFSDSETGGFPPGVPTTLPPPDATNSVFGEAYQFGFTGLGVSVTSDAEAVPVPGSAWAGMVLMGGLGLLRASRKRGASIA